MNETPFEQFIALVQVDQKINALRSSIVSLQLKNKENQQADHVQMQAVEKAKQKLHDMRKEVDSKELEMKILDQQESEKKQKLDNVANHKEYQGIKTEIDRLKHAQHELEEGLITAWNQLDNAKKEHEASQELYSKQANRLNEQIKKNEEEISNLQKEVDELIAQRSEKEKTVPAEWIEKYALMRARVANPVVPVIDGNCSACFYKVSVQDMQSLQRRRLVQCKDCFRLLYLEGVHTTPATVQGNS